MNFTAAVIAEFLKGRIEGNPEAAVNDVSKIEEGKTGTLSFLANPKYEKHLYETASSVVIINEDLELREKVKPTLIRVPNAYESFAALLRLYEQSKPAREGLSEKASIHADARLGEKCFVGDFTVIEEGAEIGTGVQVYPQVYIGAGVKIGSGSILYPGVKIYEGCSIGEHCVIHAGAVIGADGFGFAPDENGVYEKVPQLGRVLVEDHVEIGANTTVDRATMGETILRQGAKLDNLIMIAHNVEIGENAVLAGQAGIAGSTKVGKGCMLGGQVGLSGHVKIAPGVKIAAQSGITKDIKEEGIVIQGSPAFEFGPYQRSYLLFRKLPQLREQILDLEKKVEQLEKNR